MVKANYALSNSALMFSNFQAKFGRERVKASKVILNQSKLSRFDKPFGGGLVPPCI